ncbi:MAG: group 1 glycosyl transferase, partial [Rhizobiales bacterium]|nr:group 1 glycosyl transferase [Hyphomicrobiales bacterium]
VKGKIVTSLFHGVPVVCSPIAAEGMGLGEEAGVLVADGAAAMSEAVLALYADFQRCTTMSASGARFVEAHFSESAARKAMTGLLDGMGVAFPSPRPRP